jgi:hypothetical protein
MKLSNGEEFMANVISETDKVEFENPTVVIPNGEGIVFQPWCPWTEDRKFALEKEDVMMILPCKRELEEAFSKHFGLVVAAAPKIITG